MIITYKNSFVDEIQVMKLLFRNPLMTSKTKPNNAHTNDCHPFTLRPPAFRLATVISMSIRAEALVVRNFTSYIP